MSTRPGRWPVTRPTAYLIAAALIAGAVAAKAPALRGGLFLLAGASAAGYLVARDTGYRIRGGRRPTK
jgi:hypothetical protein